MALVEEMVTSRSSVTIEADGVAGDAVGVRNGKRELDQNLLCVASN